MTFSLGTIQQAWERASGNCECNRNYHSHVEDNKRCKTTLIWESKEKEGERGSWYPHHIISVANGGQDDVNNCEILCYECYKSAAWFGYF